jgi:GntR family transcriptional regulator/MocR family aminotransferase
MRIFLDETKKRSFTPEYMGIRCKILSGELEAGQSLPSSRDLSRELCVARNTVLTAYDMLVSEGAVYSVPGSGFYVSSDVKYEPHSVSVDDQQTASLSDYAITEKTINFDSGIPALDLFPRQKWNRAVSRAFLDAPVSALGYDDPQGRPEFRSILSELSQKNKGDFMQAEQIIVTAGTKQGLVVWRPKCLCIPEGVWMEDPSNANVYKNILLFHRDNNQRRLRLMPRDCSRSCFVPGKAHAHFYDTFPSVSYGRDPADATKG